MDRDLLLCHLFAAYGKSTMQCYGWQIKQKCCSHDVQFLHFEIFLSSTSIISSLNEDKTC